jgi:hypothetical protein
MHRTTVQGVVCFFKSQPEDLRATHPLLDEILMDAHVSSVHEGQYVIDRAHATDFALSLYSGSFA